MLWYDIWSTLCFGFLAGFWIVYLGFTIETRNLFEENRRCSLEKFKFNLEKLKPTEEKKMFKLEIHLETKEFYSLY